MVGGGKFGQKFKKVFFEFATVVDVDIFVGVGFACGRRYDGVAGVGFAVIIQCGVFVFQSQSGIKSERPHTVGGLVVECRAEGAVHEVATEQKLSRIPRNRVGGKRHIAMRFNQLADALVFESNRRYHIVMPVESKSAHQPAIGSVSLGARNQIFGEGMLFTLLCEREIGLCGEVLVERHIVVEVLIRGDAAERKVSEISLNG